MRNAMLITAVLSAGFLTAATAFAGDPVEVKVIAPTDIKAKPGTDKNVAPVTPNKSPDVIKAVPTTPYKITPAPAAFPIGPMPEDKVKAVPTTP